MSAIEQLNKALNDAKNANQQVIGIYLSSDAMLELRELLPDFHITRLTTDELIHPKPIMLFGYVVAPMQSGFKKETELFRLIYAEDYK